MDKNTDMKDITSLESMADYAISKLSEQTPFLFCEGERAVANEILGYTSKIMQLHGDGALSHENAESVAENLCGGILDGVSELNTVFFEAGMKFGASLILRLLDIG